jgi:hypothetical protein
VYFQAFLASLYLVFDLADADAEVSTTLLVFILGVSAVLCGCPGQAAVDMARLSAWLADASGIGLAFWYTFGLCVGMREYGSVSE